MKTLNIRIPKSVATRIAAKVSKKFACGCHSELPTDTKWNKLRPTAFNVHQREKGNNKALIAAMVAAYNNTDF